MSDPAQPDPIAFIANLVSAAARPPEDAVTPTAEGVTAAGAPKPQRPRKSKAKDGEPGADRGPSRADADAALDGIAAACGLFRSPDGAAYATFTIKGRRETHAVRSRRFRNHLSGEVYRAMGRTIGAQKVEDALRVMEDRAERDCPIREPWLRVGAADGRLYVDLGDEGWNVVEIRDNGWGVIGNPGLPFIRKPGMLPLPVPEDGFELAELRPFVNGETEADFLLVVGWLVAALHPGGPYPVASIGGRQGSGKSKLTRNMRQLVDPNHAEIRSPPKDERDLVIAAKNARVLAFDNLSRIETWLADGLCRISHGAGFSTRMLHSDDEEMLFSGRRPIAINSIPEVAASAPDLAERTLPISLRPIRKDERRAERELDAAWAVARPRIFGTLLTGLSASLRNRDRIELPELPRMADFVKLIAESESGLGLEPGSFVEAFRLKSAEMTEAAFSTNAVAVAVHRFVLEVYRGRWEGSATELLDRLNDHTTEQTKRARSWPQTAQGMGSAIARVSPLLESRGITVEHRKSGSRTIILAPTGGPHG